MTEQQIPLYVSYGNLGVKTNPTKAARNLGAIFDKNVTFLSHMSAVCSPRFYHIRDPRRIRRHLDLDSAKLLATALVSSRLDNWNSILYGIVDNDLTSLQRVQNRLALTVTKLPPFTHSVPLFPSMIASKILNTVQVCWPIKRFMKSSCLSSLQPCFPSRSLSVDLQDLVCKSSRSRPTQAQELSTLVPRLLGTTSHCLSVQPYQLLRSRNIWRHIFDWLGLSPLGIGTPDSPLIPWNCFINFAIEHWFGCCDTEPGLVGDIGAIEIWLIDWKIITMRGLG